MGFTMQLIRSTKMTRTGEPRAQFSYPQTWVSVALRVLLP
jgi:hypothetical protein